MPYWRCSKCKNWRVSGMTFLLASEIWLSGKSRSPTEFPSVVQHNLPLQTGTAAPLHPGNQCRECLFCMKDIKRWSSACTNCEVRWTMYHFEHSSKSYCLCSSTCYAFSRLRNNWSGLCNVHTTLQFVQATFIISLNYLLQHCFVEPDDLGAQRSVLLISVQNGELYFFVWKDWNMCHVEDVEYRSLVRETVFSKIAFGHKQRSWL